MIQFLNFVFLLLGFLYFNFIGWVVYQWISTAYFQYNDNEDHNTDVKVSIIIPFRNEESNLAQLLKSLDNQSYPKENTEIIVVDDHSTDESVRVIEEFSHLPLKLLHNDSDFYGKKAALSKGIDAAQHSLIITTDADCEFSEHWLSSTVFYSLQHNCDFSSSAVDIRGGSAFANIQSLENVAMMIITHAGYTSGAFHLANGANLSFRKSDFIEVAGYSAHGERASGDDVLLAQSLAGEKKLCFLKCRDAVVETSAESSFRDFWNQRLRWAGKSDLYEEDRLKLIQALVAFFYGCTILSFCLIPLVGIDLALLLLLIKIVGDVALFLCGRKFLMIPWKRVLYLPVASIFHLLYVPVVGLVSTIKKSYTWKGRRVK